MSSPSAHWTLPARSPGRSAAMPWRTYWRTSARAGIRASWSGAPALAIGAPPSASWTPRFDAAEGEPLRSILPWRWRLDKQPQLAWPNGKLAKTWHRQKGLREGTLLAVYPADAQDLTKVDDSLALVK